MSVRSIGPFQDPFISPILDEKDAIKKEFDKLVQERPSHKGLAPDLFQVGRAYHSRNRYSNILPNEATRVKIEEDSSFYFNANWVLGEKVVASQGPMEGEIREFWQMVWHCNIEAVVMLTNLTEGYKGKCSHYWKDGYYGNIKIQSSEETVLFQKEGQNILKREITLSKGREVKKIIHYQLENWPDSGIVNPVVLAELVKLVSQEQGKILTHCSAGIGRTGTFLTVYGAYLLRQGIYSVACDLRDPAKGRVGAIQNQDQYVLAYATLRELE